MNSVRVAIIGSGPSGFYAAEELLTQTTVKVSVDMLDCLPTPYGLVRGGVAPDHQKIKTVIKVYEKTAQREGFRFFGNVEYGKDISLTDLLKINDAVIFAVGSKSDRKMNIPGEDLHGSHAATEFVGWYNAHPDYRDLTFDLSGERVAVVGNGNVAMDVTRILAADPDHLSATDIAGYALDSLRRSRVKEIYLLGRRGPAQAAFTNPEIRELCDLPGADLIVDPGEVDLDDLSKGSLTQGIGGMTAKNNVQILTDQSRKLPAKQGKKIIVKFLTSPTEIFGKGGRVSSLELEKNVLYRDSDGTLRPKGTGVKETIPVDMVLRSVGYKGISLPDLPYDDKKGTIPNDSGRVLDLKTKKAAPRIYVVGWAKRGPSGVIGTNKPDSIETARNLLEDVSQGMIIPRSNPESNVLESFLRNKNVRFVTFRDWKALDDLETANGRLKNKIRDKFTSIREMISALDSLKAEAPSV